MYLSVCCICFKFTCYRLGNLQLISKKVQIAKKSYLLCQALSYYQKNVPSFSKLLKKSPTGIKEVHPIGIKESICETGTSKCVPL